jgi:hypothetical protein
MLKRFGGRLDALEGVFIDWAGTAPRPLPDRDIMFLEGLVSTLWQHWSLFCRRVVFSSALGCITRSGTVIAPCVAPTQWERVSYVALRVYAGANVHPAVVNTNLKREPTWGDVKRVQNIVTVLSPGNAAQLVNCLGSVSRGPIDVQLVRNASAHRNAQTFAAVKSLNVYYNATRIRHPVEAVTWVDPASGDFAFMAWIDEMRLLGDLMTT